MNLPERIVAIDFETTGLVPNYDSITSVALAYMDKGDVLDAWYCKVKPSMNSKFSLAALSVQTGEFSGTPEEMAEVARNITTMFDGAFDGGEMAEQFRAFSAKHDLIHVPVVSHVAAFDKGFYDQRVLCFKSIFRHPPLSPLWICTKELASIVFADPRIKLSLDSVLLHLGMGGRNSHVHGAMEDAILAGKVYDRLRVGYELKFGGVES